jgi:putative flippase GtrA
VVLKTPSDLLTLSRSPEGKKMIRYTATSVFCVVISEVVLTILGLAGWSARAAVLAATAVSTIPSYELNRKWAWGKSGKSHMGKEVIPFWALAFVGLAFSLWAVDFAASVTRSDGLSRLLRTGVTDGAFIGAYGVLWIGKFLIFNRILFAHHPEDLPPALDGRTGIPG